MIEKKVFIDQITVTATNQVQIRQTIQILEDGIVLSESFHRWVLSPGSDISTQDPKVQAVCQAAWKFN